MKSRPILFSAPMVKAILDGSKTQTRRIIKTQPDCSLTSVAYTVGNHESRTVAMREGRYSIFCPYGLHGDQLWVRETWAEVTGPVAGESAESFGRKGIIYRADEGNSSLKGIWKPSIFMRRFASRITLEITAIRVERLQDISEEDAKAEGCDGNCPIGHIPSYQKAPYGYHYSQLWTSINGPGSWDANPWVWVLEFRRIAP